MLSYLKSQFKSIEFVTAQLGEGDYLSDKVIVERKRIDDFDGSISGRLHDQISRLTTHHRDKLVVLGIAGSVDDYIMDMKKRRPKYVVDEERLHKMVASVMVRDDIRVVWHYHDKKMLKEIVYIMQAVEDGKLDVPSVRNCDMLMARLLNVSKDQWYEIKKVYGTSPCFLCRLTKKQLMVVKGIGAKKADTILNFLQYGW